MVFPYINLEMVWGGLPVSYSSPLETMAPLVMVIFVSFVIWDVIWKGISLWKAGRNNQLGWFIALLIVNSLGILPIIYILFFQKKKEETIIIPKDKAKKKEVKK